MEILQTIIQFYQENATVIATVALAILSVSESLPYVNKIKANGVGQLILSILQALATKKKV